MSQQSSSSPTDQPGDRARAAALDVLERGGLVIFLVGLVVFFAVFGTTASLFLTHANVQNVLSNQTVTALVALSMVVPLLCGYFDLSVAAITGLANVTMAALAGTHGLPVWLSVVAAIAAAALCGSINGLLVAGLKLNAFVVTLGTYTLIGGMLQYYTQGQTISNGIPESFKDLGSSTVLGIPSPLILLLLIALVLWYAVTQTPLGREDESIGSNERAARLVGISVDRNLFLTFLGSSVLAGVAGVVLTSQSGNADPTAGPAYLFPALAAVFLGATAFRPGHYNVWGTVVGVFVIAVAVDGLTLAGADAWVTPVFNGTALVLAVTISTLTGRHRENRARRSSIAAVAMRDVDPGSGAEPPLAVSSASGPGAASRHTH